MILGKFHSTLISTMEFNKGAKTHVVDGDTPAVDRGIIGVLMTGTDHTMFERL